MIIAGLQKHTLIDYPGYIAAVVFTAGCNLRCSYCHNPEMVLPEEIQKNKSLHVSERIFWNFLERRQGLLDGISICGGEPTIHRDLPDFCRRIKDLGYKVKLDTNGAYPHMLEYLVANNLLDYIAMDIKHTWEKYSLITRRPINTSYYKQSMDIIRGYGGDYEFRTTLIGMIHTLEDIEEMAQQISGSKKYFLQNFRDNATLDVDFNGTSFSPIELQHFCEIASRYVEICEVR